jgi:alanyl-tRNA synthetase
MKTSEIRQKYLDFFEKRGHKIVASASLLPENDPTTLFTGSGMQPLLPYLLGSPHPEGKRVVDSQKCFRAEDLDEVGDNRHTTFFEMLGNWSLGDYFKKEQLRWFFEFLTDELKLDPNRIYVTVFSGDEKNNIPRDTESVEIWKQLFIEKGIEAKDIELISEEQGGKLGMQNGRIFYYDAKKNWWSRAGVPDNMPPGEPGGPDSEVFYEFVDVPHDKKYGEYCHPNCDCGRFMEIGNSVFMEYRKIDGGFEELIQKNVDFGGGLERITAAILDTQDVFKIDALQDLIIVIERLTGKSYTESNEAEKFAFRVVVDHLRAATFLINDGAEPSNKEQGYVVRRLLRRSVRFMDKLGMKQGSLCQMVDPVIETYKSQYLNLVKNSKAIKDSIEKEEAKFRQTLDRGLREFDKLANNELINGKDAFTLFATFGFPIEITQELAAERGLKVDREAYDKEFEGHKEASRAGISTKFHGGLADHSWETTQGHTATHLLQATLRNVLGDHVFQKGSNITKERLRFDFSHPDKLTPEQISEVEEKMNQAIRADYPVSWKEMSFDEAQAVGALGLFEDRYGEKVKVYSMGDYSHEVCGGPHVEHTNQVEAFKIIKEEAVGRGVRRIKALSGKSAVDAEKV